LKDAGVTYVMLSDTIGVADEPTIEYFFKNITTAFPDMDFGAHFHTTASTWKRKIEPAFLNGCRRFDGAIKGYGGCPMAKDELTSHTPTVNLIQYFSEKNEPTGIDAEAFAYAMKLSSQIFPQPINIDHYNPEQD